ncbi:MAG: ATP-binding cassette domain-containing protein [Chlamydiales bacterium]|nr:ATP-binding cassette domain-containing protein [Chlamydiales bacterium]
MSMIKVKDLWKAYGKQQVLKGLSLDVERGQTMVILGRSGAGKSVTLRCIMGLEQPEKGEIEVDGLHLSKMTQRERFKKVKHVAMLFQGAALFDSLSVGENTAFFLTQHEDLVEQRWLKPDEIKDRVHDALKLVGLEDTEHKMVSDLSGGMRRRVALARLIVYRPTVILYDEPTAGLDPVTAMSINELIRNTQEELKATSIVVTHDLRSALEVGDRIAYHHEGQIIQVADKDEFFNTDDSRVQAFLNNTLLPDQLSHRRKNVRPD